MAKVLVSLDDRLLERLGRAARERGLRRSALIVELASRGLGEPLGPGADPRARQAAERIEEIFRRHRPIGDTTALIRTMRDNRAERDARAG